MFEQRWNCFLHEGSSSDTDLAIPGLRMFYQDQQGLILHVHQVIPSEISYERGLSGRVKPHGCRYYSVCLYPIQ